MVFLKKHKIVVFTFLVLIFYFAFWKTGVNILDEDVEEFKDKGEERVVEDVKPADVIFRIDTPGYSGYSFLSVEIRMENTDTVYDLIERLRGDNFLTYELVDYIDSTMLTSINGIGVEENQVWNIYDNGELVDDWMNRKLDDNNVYEIRLESIEY